MEAWQLLTIADFSEEGLGWAGGGAAAVEEEEEKDH
jgi:hypothetical protein